MYQDPSLRIEVARLHQRYLIARALSTNRDAFDDDGPDLPPPRTAVRIGTLAQRLTAMLPPRAWRPSPAS